ncbi:MAG: YkvA family protein [Prevotella sp.]|nr:YkvA family protein [Prevotella sp.]
MELPDFMSYSDKFSSGDFVDKIQRIAKRAGSKLVYGSLLLYYTMQSDKVSRKDKAIIIGALGYLISPLDVMPDAIPIVGLADDMAVLVYVLKKVWSLVSDEARQKAKDKMHLWFDDDEMNDVDSIIDDNEQYTEG